MNPFIDETAPAIAVDYARILVNHVRQSGGNQQALLQSAGLEEAELNAPDGFLNLKTYRKLVGHARIQLDEPALGLALGRKLNLSTHGPLGHAVLASGEARDSIRLACKYMKIRNAACEIDFHTTELTGTYSLRIQLPVDELYVHMVEEAIASYTACLAALSVDTGQLRIACAYPRPAHARAYYGLFGEAVEFGASANTVTLPRQAFEAMTLHRDPTISEIATRQCDTLMARVGSKLLLAEIVSQLLLKQPGYFPNQKEIAAELNMSTRSLVRRLQGSGTSFSTIVNNTRKQLAIEKLTQSETSIEDIATLLGYECPPNFTRSFKQWTGQNPRAYRQQH